MEQLQQGLIEQHLLQAHFMAVGSNADAAAYSALNDCRWPRMWRISWTVACISWTI